VEQPNPPPSPRQDAAAFARFAVAAVENDPVGAALLDYDAAFNHAAEAGALNAMPPQPDTIDDAYGLTALAASPRLVKTFVLDVLALIRNRQPQRAAATAGSTLMFYRPFGVDTVRVSAVGQMTALLLDRADGTRTLQAVLDETRLQAPTAGRPKAPLRDLVQRLWTAGALCFMEPPTASRERR
jgi:hypothetical protein